jgi:hypothetical protein
MVSRTRLVRSYEVELLILDSVSNQRLSASNLALIRSELSLAYYGTAMVAKPIEYPTNKTERKE